MLKRALRSLLDILFSKRLSAPTSAEQAALALLLAEFRDLPIVTIAEQSPSEAEWADNMNKLRDLVLREDPRKFLQWGIVAHTMFIVYAPYIAKELRHLKHRQDWDARWKKALLESPIGYPTPYIFYPKSSANLIHHAYHVARFEETIGRRIDSMDFIFEFGGGYGSMYRLIHNLGFRGKYIIFDLPPFSALQRYYLRSLGFPVCSLSDFANMKDTITCTSDLESLKGLLSDGSSLGNSLMIATWSLSETPISIRDPLTPFLAYFESYLIAYQHRFGEVDNVKYFEHWKASHTTVDWSSWSIPHMPGNSYLIGKPRMTHA